MRRRGFTPPTRRARVLNVRLGQRLRLARAAGSWSSPRGFGVRRPAQILRRNQPGAAARAGQGCQGRVVLGVRSRPGGERRAILIQTRWKFGRRAFLASGVGFAGLLAGCGDGNKSDGQIKTAPEAGNAADAIAKSYSENMIKKYAKKKK